MSLTTRFSLASASLVVVTSLVLGWLVFGEFERHLLATKLADLQRGAELQGLRWSGIVEQLRRDVRFLARTPPIQGIVRAIDAGTVDPEDGSRLDLWLVRLETIFEQMLLSNKNYVQARYIGLADAGRELVRVDRYGPGGAVHRVRNENLQSKGARDYVARIVDVPAGGFYVAPIDLNREHGQIVRPFEPTLRVATPVHSGDGALFGLVILNLDLRNAIESLGTLLRDGWEFRIVNDDGYYLHDPVMERQYGFEFGKDPIAFTDYSFLTGLDGDESSAVVQRQDGDVLVMAHRVDHGGRASPRGLVFLVESPNDVRWTAAWQVVQHIGVYVVLLLAAAVLFGVWFARRISRPILALAHAVTRAQTGGGSVRLPADLAGEAGVLGAAMQAAYDELLHRQRALERSNRELDQFAHIASHDLQEPVRTVSTFASLLEEDYGDKLDEDGRKQLQFIVESSARMRSLIHSLLEYGRLGREPELRQVDCGRVLGEIREDLGTVLGETGGRLECGELPVLLSDRDHLRLLFQNLVTNAIKFRRKEVPPVVRVTASAGAVAGRWHFVVSDNGIGVPKDQRERIFLIFQRLHSRAEFEGTGIGLAHCKKIVELHAGRIWVADSELGGAAFHCELENLR